MLPQATPRTYWSLIISGVILAIWRSFRITNICGIERAMIVDTQPSSEYSSPLRFESVG
jgi:hypothetical protein